MKNVDYICPRIECSLLSLTKRDRTSQGSTPPFPILEFGLLLSVAPFSGRIFNFGEASV